MPLPSDRDKMPKWLTAKLAELVWRTTPDCREVVRLTSAECDRPLPVGIRIRLWLHRRFCKWCARYARQVDLLRTASRRFDEHLDEVPGMTFEDNARARIKERLRHYQRLGF